MKLKTWVNPKPDEVSDTVEGFLKQLGGPTVIDITGERSEPYRVCTTLLHGNEPSGVKAIHRLLLEGFTPITDCKFVIASITAALTPPLFSNRMLPGQDDLNRCFGNGYPQPNNLQINLADSIKQALIDCEPAAIVDIHNTSGAGPAFAVTVRGGDAQTALASFFTSRLIKTDIRLGSLMEVQTHCPIVTIEAGGSQESHADECAYEGIKNFLNAEDIGQLQRTMDTLHHPRRLELLNGSDVCYQNQPCGDHAVTLREDLEKYNFGVTPHDTVLGWVDDKGLDNFSLDNPNHWATDYFHVKDGQLLTRRDLKLFMVTTQPTIARSDCLFYFCS